MQKLYGILPFVLISFFPMAPALAQSQDACAILASKLTPDLSAQTSYSTRFSLTQQIIANEKYRKYSEARSTSLDSGLSIPDYVDATLGTKSDQKNWEENWEKFRSVDFAKASASASFSSVISKWNPAVIAQIVQNCPPKGFYGQITGVADDHGSFAITLNGIGNWQLDLISAVPEDTLFKCGTDSDASTRHPIPKTGTVTIQCQKDPNKSLLVSISSNEGTVGPLNLLSVADDLRRKSDEYAKTMDARTLDLQEQINAIGGTLKVPAPPVQLRRVINKNATAVSGSSQVVAWCGNDTPVSGECLIISEPSRYLIDSGVRLRVESGEGNGFGCVYSGNDTKGLQATAFCADAAKITLP